MMSFMLAPPIKTIVRHPLIPWAIAGLAAVAAIFFAVLKRGEIFVDIETKYVSKDLVEVLQAIIIIFVASFQRFIKK